MDFGKWIWQVMGEKVLAIGSFNSPQVIFINHLSCKVKLYTLNLWSKKYLTFNFDVLSSSFVRKKLKIVFYTETFVIQVVTYL